MAACGAQSPPRNVATPARLARLTEQPSRPYLMFITVAPDDSHQHVALASLNALDAGRYVTPLSCERVYYAAGHGICLTSSSNGPTVSHFADVFNERFEPTAHVPLTGPPSRVRVSGDGRRAAATVFEEGHSYAQDGFSTRTTVIDLVEGKTLCDLEDFAVWKDGKRIHGKDFNFWGLTFARDGNGFFATLDTGGVSYLVRGDVDKREVHVVRAGVECPSLSPDNARLAFKKRIGSRSRGWWQLTRLDLSTNTETVLSKETRSVDDQVEWIDDQAVAYHLTGAETAADLWVLPVDGTSAPRILLPNAYSPAVVR
jgi:hypothetical protein